MCNDANRDTKAVSMATLTEADESNSESKDKRDDSDANSLNTLPINENDFVKAKLEQERAGIASQDDTHDSRLSDDMNLHIASHYVSNLSSDFHQWLESYPHNELYDHDLEFCGRKVSNFYRTQRRQNYAKPKKYRQCKKQNVNKPKFWRNENITFGKNTKKSRKKELALNRRTKMEKLMQEEMFEPEEEFCEETDILPSPPVEKSGLEFLLCDENIPEELEPNLLQFLLDLQDREVTPEDYELLLQLDDSVAKKALPDERVVSLVTDTVSEEHADGTCNVCMENYVVGETRKILPCGHVFHESCIKTWLTCNSTKCPLDNLEV